MSILDEIFKCPQPGRIVNTGLYQVYMAETLTIAQRERWPEEKVATKLQSLEDYLKFLSSFNDMVVQEIADVSDQLYGPLNDGELDS